MDEIFEAGLKEITIVLITDAIRSALHERSTQGNWFPRAWERSVFHPNAKPTPSCDFENMLFLLSDESYPWFVLLGIDHEGVKVRLQRTSAYRRLVNVVRSGSRIGNVYKLFLMNECGICIGGSDERET